MRKSALNKLAKLSLIHKETLKQLEPNQSALNANIAYWTKQKLLISLKKGLYITRSSWNHEQQKEDYLEFLANRLYEPSYLSLEYVMAKHNLLTEAAFSITSITTRKTKQFTNPLGQFNYYSISPHLFTGFSRQNPDNYPVLAASKAKAVFDYLYLRFLKSTPINQKFIEELRINWDQLRRSEFKQLNLYASLSTSQRIKQVIRLIKALYYA